MLEKIIFENHQGKRFDFLENGVYVNHNDLRDYSWSYDTANNRISRFYRSITNRKLPLVIVGKNADAAIEAKHKLLELAEADIEAMRPGKIFVGEYYTHGYITESAKSDYLISKRYCKNDLTLTSDDPSWYREKRHSFVTQRVAGSTPECGTDYAYDYPYDYSQSASSQKLVCDSIGKNAFKMLIYGATENPTITIGGHVYAINGKIGAGETILIDSLEKTITLTTATGSKTNWFDKRSRDSYVFEPIPAGTHTVVWNGTFGFDLTVIEKRSEPRWI
jgi:hypothetical protein